MIYGPSVRELILVEELIIGSPPRHTTGRDFIAGKALGSIGRRVPRGTAATPALSVVVEIAAGARVDPRKALAMIDTAGEIAPSDVLLSHWKQANVDLRLDGEVFRVALAAGVDVDVSLNGLLNVSDVRVDIGDDLRIENRQLLADFCADLWTMRSPQATM